MCITLSLRGNKLEIKLFLRMSAKHKPQGMNEADNKKVPQIYANWLGSNPSCGSIRQELRCS